jgi:cystathionine beta-synthase
LAAPPRSVLGLVGDTPLVEVTRLDAGPCRLFLKLESQNPGGSIKDRIGVSMIRAATQDGRLKPGGTIVEATAGNTGLGLALVAAQTGHRLVLVIPDKMSEEKVRHLRALGAEVRMTRSDVGKGHPEYYQDLARRLVGEIPGAWLADQFGNPANPAAHEAGTGPEISRQMEGKVDAVVCGVGSGGTLTGLSRHFARVSPATRMILADPAGSILAEYVRSKRVGAVSGSWLVEGIGEDFVPPVADFSRVAEAYTVADDEAFATARLVLAKEGLLVGSSSGTLIAAALRYCRARTRPERVVTFVCDTGNKYLSKMYDDGWMTDQGFLERPKRGDLSDLIARRHERGEVVTVGTGEALAAALTRMKSAGVSQLPVMDGERVVGIVDESDLLLAVAREQHCFDDPVSRVVHDKLETIRPDAPLADLMDILARGRVGVVVDGERFLGLITKIDVLNHFRRDRRVIS